MSLEEFQALDSKCMPYINNMPHIEDKTLFIAVCYTEVLFTCNNLPMQSAIYKAASRYKVKMADIAKCIGRWSWNRKNNLTGEAANFKGDK